MVLPALRVKAKERQVFGEGVEPIEQKTSITKETTPDHEPEDSKTTRWFYSMPLAGVRYYCYED